MWPYSCCLWSHTCLALSQVSPIPVQGPASRSDSWCWERTCWTWAQSSWPNSYCCGAEASHSWQRITETLPDEWPSRTYRRRHLPRQIGGPWAKTGWIHFYMWGFDSWSMLSAHVWSTSFCVWSHTSTSKWWNQLGIVTRAKLRKIRSKGTTKCSRFSFAERPVQPSLHYKRS